MHHRSLRVIFALLAAALAPASLSAQTPEQRADSLEREIRRLQARLDSLVRVVQRLAREGGDTTPADDELAALRGAARAAAGPAERPDTGAEQQSRTRSLQILNPEISITGDFVGHFTAPGGEASNVSATPREFEFSFQAALDPFSHTKIFVTREQDFEIAGFPEEQGDEEEGHGFEIEEGYMYWVGLPGGFGAKLGKFRQELGLYNRWHTHALFDVERPLATTLLLGEDGLIQTGAAVTLPSVTLGPGTQTVAFEITAGSNDALFAGGNQLSYLGRLQSFWELSASSFLQLGANGVWGQNDEADLVSRLASVDVYFRWTPPGRALYRDFQFKGEWYVAEREEIGVSETARGGYAQASVRAGRRWILGARADYVEPFEEAPRLVQLVPSITWWQSEWVRIRLQYNYLRPEGGPGNHTLLLQTVWAMGPHKHEAY